MSVRDLSYGGVPRLGEHAYNKTQRSIRAGVIGLTDKYMTSELQQALGLWFYPTGRAAGALCAFLAGQVLPIVASVPSFTCLLQRLLRALPAGFLASCRPGVCRLGKRSAFT